MHNSRRCLHQPVCGEPRVPRSARLISAVHRRAGRKTNRKREHSEAGRQCRGPRSELVHNFVCVPSISLWLNKDPCLALASGDT